MGPRSDGGRGGAGVPQCHAVTVTGCTAAVPQCHGAPCTASCRRRRSATVRHGHRVRVKLEGKEELWKEEHWQEKKAAAARARPGQQKVNFKKSTQFK